LYNVSFTYFGVGKGDYQLKQSTNNGRVFEFVAGNMIILPKVAFSAEIAFSKDILLTKEKLDFL
jgi:hypothetical protein